MRHAWNRLYEKRPQVDPFRSGLGCLVATLLMMAVCAAVIALGGYAPN